jgi:enediyne biosynthesis protein E4
MKPFEDRARSWPLPLILAILAFAIAVFWTLTPRDDQQRNAFSRSPSTQAEPDQKLLNQFFQVEAQQNQLDQTVWATELLAEKHEDVFVKLWDDLRAQVDEFATLENFLFGELLCGKPGPAAKHDHGIEEFRLDQTPQKTTPQQWHQLLKTWKSEGYRIEQTEWRHPQFEPGPPAKSLISIVAHVNNPAKKERLILRGNLTVEWQESSDSHSPPVPRLIDATGLDLLTCQGDSAFQAVLSTQVEPDEGTIFIDPLILYDLDGDGLSEVILGCKNLVFWNRGKGELQKESLCPQLRGLINTCIIADFDGDGLADFLAADRDGLLLFAGDSLGRFLQPARRVWPSSEPLLNPFVITAGDIDGDGHLDIWLAQYKLPYVGGQMPTPYYDANDGFPSFLLVNDGHGNFHDATGPVGLAGKRFRRTYSSSFVDLDDDGDLDLVVVSDFAGVDVYRNDGRGHFTDVTDRVFEETHAFGMAQNFGDYDGDGRLDFLMVGMNSFVARRLDHLNLGPSELRDNQDMRSKMSYGNRLCLSRGGKFQQTSLSGQVARSGWSWGATSFDFDNDGDLDIYIVNGHKSRRSVKDYETQFWLHDIYLATSRLDPAIDLYFRARGEKLYGAGQSYGGHEKNRLFMNESGKAFLEVGYLMGVSAEEDCRNVVSDDLDGDGKLDLLLTTFEEWPQKRQGLHILQNRGTASGNWIGVRLREHGRGYSPVGAKVILDTPAGKQVRQVVTGDSYRSQQANSAHFGLGKETRVNGIEVRWPNGRVQKIPEPAVNRYYTMQP